MREINNTSGNNIEITGRKELNTGKQTTKTKMLNRDLSSSENIKVGMSVSKGPSEISPHSAKGRSKAARKISSKNIMSSKQQSE